MRHQDKDTINRIRHRYDRLTDPYREPGGRLALPTAALLAAATAP